MGVPARPADDPAAWFTRPTLRGGHVTLRPLRLADAEAWPALLGDEATAREVWAWMTVARPRDAEQARAVVRAHLQRQDDRQSVCFTQTTPRDDAPIGMTSFYDIDPAVRTLAIGWTWIAKPYWASGVNTEAKLLLLSRAFDELGAARVVWHVDINNARSQAAVRALGAVQEGILRKHRIRPDGSWRDTVQFCMTDDDWPAARAALRIRLAAKARTGPREVS
ncbi:GNAT family N-acetyltransferase [Cumulibacter manganitolerans]|uniref:GNAT family N-acetyltransferase n=1 Tax=Cumulibacter manganitolerans TaxID=1884992 RepID=UPI001297B47B|nr:GNAT family protein [Cumulibacter manganitolerans]